MKQIIYITTVLLLLFALVLTWNANRDKAQKLSDMEATQGFDTLLLKKLDSARNVVGQIVSSQEVAEVRNQETIRNLFNQVFLLKKEDEKRVREVRSLIRAVQRTEIKEVHIPYARRIDSSSFFTSDSLILRRLVVVPPEFFRDSTPHYDISGTVLLDGVKMDTVSFTDTASLAIVQQTQRGLLKRIFSPGETVVKSVHTNPYVQDLGLQTVVIKQRPNVWNRILKPVIAFLAGSYITYKITQQ